MTVRLEGWDGDTISFAVQSETTKDLWYEVWVVTETGNTLCGLSLEGTDLLEWDVLRGCKDRKFRRRIGNLDRPANPCKHIAEITRRIKVLIAMSKHGATDDELAAMLDDRIQTRH